VVLAVTLDASGELRDLSVVRSSAVDFVDRIAMASVREAQPFPNPPQGLFEGQERARIPFAFTIYPAERRPALRWRPPDRP
jgi:TonB family protein